MSLVAATRRLPAIVAAASVSLALALPARAVHAAPEGAESPASDSTIDEARGLYEEGVGRYETADYEGAIDLWTRAYTMLPNDARGATIKGILISDLASAREKAYDVDHDPEQLRQAKLLLDDYLENLEILYADGPERDKERASTQERLDRVEARLAEHEAAQGEAADQALAKEDEAARARALVGVGATFTSLGGASLGVAIAGMVIGAGANDVSGDLETDYEARGSQFESGRTGNLLAIIGGAGAGVFLITGVALLVVGKTKQKRLGLGDDVAVVPVLGPQTAGVGLHARF